MTGESGLSFSAIPIHEMRWRQSLARHSGRTALQPLRGPEGFKNRTSICAQSGARRRHYSPAQVPARLKSPSTIAYPSTKIIASPNNVQAPANVTRALLAKAGNAQQAEVKLRRPKSAGAIMVTSGGSMPKSLHRPRSAGSSSRVSSERPAHADITNMKLELGAKLHQPTSVQASSMSSGASDLCADEIQIATAPRNLTGMVQFELDSFRSDLDYIAEAMTAGGGVPTGQFKPSANGDPMLRDSVRRKTEKLFGRVRPMSAPVYRYGPPRSRNILG